MPLHRFVSNSYGYFFLLTRLSSYSLIKIKIWVYRPLKRIAQQLKVLFKKNWLLQRRHPWITFFELMLPPILVSLLLIGRLQSKHYSVRIKESMITDMLSRILSKIPYLSFRALCHGIEWSDRKQFWSVFWFDKSISSRRIAILFN